MNDNRQKLEAIFDAALELSGTEREIYLTRACGEDVQLRQQVERLFRALQRAGDFLTRGEPSAETQTQCAVENQPVSNPASGLSEGPTRMGTASSEEPGDRIGRYRLRERIGEGGCGVVYVADQEEPVRRRVALKVIKPGMDSKSVIARFDAERQALAMMDHPNIAKVLDAGTTDSGRPYFVMELVRGIRITEYCDQNKLSTRQRLELFIRICNAVQHAHQKGIIHRDLKPSNILVTVNDGVPVPKVIDFGIAKATEGRLTDLTVYTELHQFIGTPAYMSPEQAEMTSLDIDTRSDIYSLGVLLYELLTGRTPFDPKKLLEAGLDEIRRAIREVEPPRPSTRLSTLANGDLTTVAKARGSEALKLVNLIQGDLDWIVMKALEKDRTRRYDTANGFAQDVKRFLANEPILARAPSATYRFQKLVRRNKLAFAAAAAVASALVLGMVASTWQAVRARRAEQQARHAESIATEKSTLADQEKQRAEGERERANQNELATRKSLYAADMDLAFRSFEAGKFVYARQLLEKHRPTPPGGKSEIQNPKFKIERDLRGWEWRYLWNQTRTLGAITLGRHGSVSLFVAFSPDGRTLASSDYDGVLKLWDVNARRELLSTNLYGERVVPSLAWSPDGRLIATGALNGKLVVWNVEANRVEFALSLQSRIRRVAFSPDGKVLASAGRGEVRLLNVESRQEIRRILSGPIDDRVMCLDFSPDNRTLAIGSYGPQIQLWDWQSAQELASLEVPLSAQAYKGQVNQVVFSSDGQALAVCGMDQTCRLWDVPSRQPLAVLTNHYGSVNRVDFSPTGKLLVMTADDQTIRLTDLATRREVAMTTDFATEPLGVAFAPSGDLLATGSGDGTVKLWPLPLNAKPVETYTLSGLSGYAAIWPKQYLLEWYTTNSWRLWDLRKMNEIYRVSDPNVLAHAFERNQLKLFGYTQDKRIQIRDVPSGRVEPFCSHDFGDEVQVQMCISADGRLLAAAGNGRVHVWNVSTKSEIHQFQTSIRAYEYGLYFSPDANSLLARNQGAGITLWQLSTRETNVLSGHRVEGNSLKFLPDGRLLTTSLDGEMRFRDLSTGTEVNFNGGFGGYGDTAVTPDGKRLLLAAFDGFIQFWDFQSNRQMGVLRAWDHPRQYVTKVGFLDENTLASVFEDQLRIWRAPSWAEIEEAEKEK